jgi:predicted RNA binding protein YcfA (HicA-like mRNA interferase family)
MSRRSKLFQKAIKNPKNLRFDELITLLIAFGVELKQMRGSHRIFKHPKAGALLSIEPDDDSGAKPYQIRQFLKRTTCKSKTRKTDGRLSYQHLLQ